MVVVGEGADDLVFPCAPLEPLGPREGEEEAVVVLEVLRHSVAVKEARKEGVTEGEAVPEVEAADVRVVEGQAETVLVAEGVGKGAVRVGVGKRLLAEAQVLREGESVPDAVLVMRRAVGVAPPPPPPLPSAPLPGVKVGAPAVPLTVPLPPRA